MDSTRIFAFVLMPFDSIFDDIYTLGIKEAASQVGIEAQRLDEQLFADGMMERIYRQIEAADIIIADMSGKNPNVFYEVGYAHAKDKLCILLTSDAKDIPFDLKHRRHIVYNNSIKFLKQELIKNLEWARTEIVNIKKTQIRVVFKQPNGDLKVDQYIATAELDFRFDLYNDSNQPSSEINAIYFYTKNPWIIRQAGRDCARNESDISGYQYRYFLNPPILRLPGSSWAQLQFSATKEIDFFSSEDDIKHEYLISGRSLLRFITTQGVFDQEFYISTKVFDIPF